MMTIGADLHRRSYRRMRHDEMDRGARQDDLAMAV
jgi:hypothetical protein